jgi:hypothetical protein
MAVSADNEIARAKVEFRHAAYQAAAEAFAEAKAKFEAAAKSHVDAPAMRLECLKIACGSVEMAQQMYDFVIGKDAK